MAYDKTSDEVLRVLETILRAHQSKNNGAVMGEAVLCRHFEMWAMDVIAKAKGENNGIR